MDEANGPNEQKHHPVTIPSKSVHIIHYIAFCMPSLTIKSTMVKLIVVITIQTRGPAIVRGFFIAHIPDERRLRAWQES